MNFRHRLSFIGAVTLLFLHLKCGVCIGDPQIKPSVTTALPAPVKLSYRTLHIFEPSDGASLSALVRVAPLAREANTIYGTAQAGGVNTSGTLWRVNADGSGFKLLHTFAMRQSGEVRTINSDGSTPIAVIAGGDGFLYGIARESGALGQGTLWRVRPDGEKFQVLHEFSVSPEQEKSRTPTIPLSSLIVSRDGFLIGGCEQGGEDGRGYLWKIKRDGTNFKVLHDFQDLGKNVGTPEFAVFPNATGANPLFVTASGNGLLGTASNGGKYGGGVIWSCALDGSKWKILHDFEAPFSEKTMTPNRDGLSPISIAEGNRQIFGVCSEGGTLDGHLAGQGTVWAMDKDGRNFKVLKSFAIDSRLPAYRDGSMPIGSLVISHGWLYGVTRQGGVSNDTVGNGTLFRVQPDGKNFSVVYTADDQISEIRKKKITTDINPFPVRLLSPAPGGDFSGVWIEEDDTPNRREQLFLFSALP